MTTSTVDLFMVYQILKRLVTPFEEWEAFTSGVIDAEGNILVKKDKRTSPQKESFQKLDLMMSRIKRLMAKIPGGQTKIASWAAALWLVKESDDVEFGENLLDEELERKLADYITITEKAADVNSRFELFEEMTTSTVVAAPDSLNKQSLAMGKRLKDRFARRKSVVEEHPNNMKLQPRLPSPKPSTSTELGRGHDTDGNANTNDYKPKRAVSKNPMPKKPTVINKSSTTTTT